jgi:protein-S-isoprenylcysteine O-methyltransferase Ste14
MADAALTRKAFFAIARLLVLIGILLFLPAGSLNFWQAWIWLLVFSVSVSVISLYFLKRDPSFIERRLRRGPAAETERSQKIIQASISVLCIAQMVVSGFNRRFHWSHVPGALVISSDLLVVMSFVIMFLVFKENTFASATIALHRSQRVITTGPYRLVRHPMYSAALLLDVFIALALGCYWALLFVPLIFLAIVWRLLNEEKFLATNLPGYDEYCRQTQYRLIPLVW